MKMVVITLTACPPKVKGDLSKWMLEISPGVYVGNISQRVRENLWIRICENLKTGRACMVYSAHNEQRLAFQTCGSTWEPMDFDGITLIKRPLYIKEKDSNTGALQKGYSKAATYQKVKSIQKSNKNGKSDEYIVLDLETTGLDYQNDRILEVGALLVSKGDIKDRYSRIIKIKDVPETIFDLTGITPEIILKDGLPERQVLEELLTFIGNKTIIGYNVNFDLAFLKIAFKKIGINFHPKDIVDVLKIIKKQMLPVKNYKLVTIADYYSIDFIAHRALSDCEVTYKIYTKLKEF